MLLTLNFAAYGIDGGSGWFSVRPHGISVDEGGVWFGRIGVIHGLIRQVEKIVVGRAAVCLGV